MLSRTKREFKGLESQLQNDLKQLGMFCEIQELSKLCCKLHLTLFEQVLEALNLMLDSCQDPMRENLYLFLFLLCCLHINPFPVNVGHDYQENLIILQRFLSVLLFLIASMSPKLLLG